MTQYQIVTADVHLNNDSNSVVHRGLTRPLTYPEVMVLRQVHRSEGAVRNLVELRYEERNDNYERTRLRETYGRLLVDSLFPASIPLPTADEMLPTTEEIAAGAKAMRDAKAEVRSKRKTKPKAKAKPKKAEPVEADEPDALEPMAALNLSSADEMPDL